MHQLYMFFLCLFACTRTSIGLAPDYCLRGGHHAITNERQAIMAARDTWYCTHPNERQTTEQSWLNDFAATREDASWRVTTRVAEGHTGPVIGVRLAAADGRVEDVQASK